MAGTRLERLGTIFGRVTSLIRCGALKKADRPVWYDVYQIFPPLTSPSFENQRVKPQIAPIFYPEDQIRAQFHRKMFRKLPAEDLSKETTTDVTRRAIDLTNKLMLENDKLSVEEAVDQAIQMFRKEGLFFVRRSARPRASADSSETPLQAELKESNTAEEFQSTVKNITDKKIDVANLFKKEGEKS